MSRAIPGTACILGLASDFVPSMAWGLRWYRLRGRTGRNSEAAELIAENS